MEEEVRRGDKESHVQEEEEEDLHFEGDQKEICLITKSRRRLPGWFSAAK